MSNLLPAASQKNVRAQFRARFMLAIALVLLGCAVLFALALAPMEVALYTFAAPGVAQNAQGDSSAAANAAALAHTKALLGDITTLSSTTSLDAVVAALSEAGQGVGITNIDYTVSSNSLSLAGQAASPDDVNTFREALQSDLRFNNVSVPVSALLGSQDGTFTITMNITQ